MGAVKPISLGDSFKLAKEAKEAAKDVVKKV
jgi:hypothetical protein